MIYIYNTLFYIYYKIPDFIMLKKYLSFIKENKLNDLIYEIKHKDEEGYDFINSYLSTDFSFDEYLKNDRYYQLGVYDNNRMVACSIFEINGNRIHNCYSAVSSNYRNRGINKNMLLELIKFGKEKKCNIITAYIRENNISSIKSHESVGMINDDDFEDRYTDGDKKLQFYKYL